MRNSLKIDQIDYAIIQALQQDSRKPYTEIAKNLSIAESTVRNRVSRLLADNTLRLGATFDFIKLGFNASAFMSIRVQADQFDEVAEALKTIPEVSYLLAVTGEFDLMAELTCRDHEHLMDTIKKIRGISAIINTATQTILHVYKELLPSLATGKT
ncbi:MAG: Lrp/AsnC ligand binding domain-containing protein [Chloroflexota bacterium]